MVLFQSHTSICCVWSWRMVSETPRAWERVWVTSSEMGQGRTDAHGYIILLDFWYPLCDVNHIPCIHTKSSLNFLKNNLWSWIFFSLWERCQVLTAASGETQRQLVRPPTGGWHIEVPFGSVVLVFISLWQYVCKFSFI